LWWFVFVFVFDFLASLPMVAIIGLKTIIITRHVFHDPQKKEKDGEIGFERNQESKKNSIQPHTNGF
jgi:hypothetical protein